MSALQQQLQATLGDAFRLESELGGGGMSRVFVAHETALGRKVVIKVLLPELAASVSVERFRREIQLAAQLQHPHIVPLLSAGESQGLPYFVMPFVSGESLRAKVMRTGELPIAESVRILRDVVSALAYAHAFGVVHRDIKPDNVLISGGVAVVTDFGVAKAVSDSSGGVPRSTLTSLGVALGTPAYMAPEQASGDLHTDHRADIYALGVMAYEMLTGQVPFVGRSPQATLAAQVLEIPEPVDRLRPAIPPTLASLVMSCLAKRAADRPQAASEVLHTLDAIATPGSGSVATTVVSMPAVVPRRPRRARVVALAGGAATLAVVAALFLIKKPRPPATVPAVNQTHAETLGMTQKLPAPPAEVPPAMTADTQPSAPPRVSRPRPNRESEATSPRVTPTERRRPPPAASAAKAPDSVEAAPPPPVPPSVPESSAAAPTAAAPAPAPAPSPTGQAPSVPATPARPPANPHPELQDVADLIAEYSRAVESESVPNLRQVYPGMTAEQQKGWEGFFGTVHEVKSQLAIRQISMSGDVGSVLVSGMYAYVNGSTRRSEEQQVSFRATVRKTGGVWRIAEIR